MRASVPDWLLDRFEVVRPEGIVAVVRSDFLDAFLRHGLAGCPAGRSALTSGAAAAVEGGRGAAWILSDRAFGDVVVRPYRRGGWIRRLSERRYLLGARAFRELTVTEKLRREGAPVPEVLAAVQQRLSPGPGYSACLVSRRIPGTAPAAVALDGVTSREARIVMEDVGRAIRSCHEAGGWHADLNAWNLLVPRGRPDLRVTVIDWDRGRLMAAGVPDDSRRSNLDRLARSLRRLGLAEALAAWPALERGYAAEPGPTPAA